MSVGNITIVRAKLKGKLGIKWQHAHERGSGGKGGVGNNVQKEIKAPVNGGRTAGQILISKYSANKLGSVLNDKLAGEAFHKELSRLKARQAEKKRQDLRADATRQRHMQMKRKPWLQARMERK